MFLDRGGFEVMPEYSSVGIESRPMTAAVRGRSSGSGNLEHHQNWLQSIRSREQPVCDPDTARASSLLPHLGNIAYRTGARLEWDARNERCRENVAANELVGREYRTPWKI